VGEEIIQEEELMNLLKVKSNPTCYDGFEPSGRMHIAQVFHSLMMFEKESVVE
jgi:tyrosyl-tRNA synthetase